jgi:hypothetical protein
MLDGKRGTLLSWPMVMLYRPERNSLQNLQQHLPYWDELGVFNIMITLVDHPT